MGKQAGAVIDIILVLNPFNPWIEGMKRDPFGTYIESTTMEQFEAIHPFLDGNGRVGRLLITLMLCNDKVLHKPLLYPSLYFKQHTGTPRRTLEDRKSVV